MNQKKEIFTFGSNLSGRHGAGAAKYARLHHGAIMGQGIGLQGSSYALPTKGVNISFMPLKDIGKHVDEFISFAQSRPDPPSGLPVWAVVWPDSQTRTLLHCSRRHCL